MSDLAEDVNSFYGLGRDLLSTTRLYLQHWMWRRQVKYLLHPTIINASDIPTVADIGCGTGIWLIDLAEQLPRGQLDGYDISSAQFPPAKWLPANVKLSTLDALAEVPAPLVGRYDVIHIGLLVLVLGDDPGPLLRNILRMLKPGGYIQWDEADVAGLYEYRAASNPSGAKRSIEALYDLVDERFNPRGFSWSWVRSLDKIFHAEGLTVLEHRHFPIPDEIAHPWTLMHLLSIEELIKNVKDSGGDPQAWTELYTKAVEEVRAGASIRMDMVIAVGRKEA